MNFSLTVDRHVPADIQQVWLAWTTEAGLATWWWHTWSDTRYEVNALPGGTYRIEAAEHGIGVRGTYRTLDAPHRLAFSWVWYEPGEGGVPVDEPLDEVEVTLAAEAGGTRVMVVHSGPWTSMQAAEDYRQGWAFVLDALTQVPKR